MTEAQLQDAGFMRVERDDRLVDVFTKETLEKGVTLWEKWGDTEIELVRVHNGKQTRHRVVRADVEAALKTNQPLILS